jgi:DNA-binding NarL/FixJ family response regulator
MASLVSRNRDAVGNGSILSQYDESEMRARAFEVGAQGYISKSDAARQLLIAIESLISNHNSAVA